MFNPPSPHPVDHDWRYDEATARWLADRLTGMQPVLCLGAPSVARLLEQRGVDVTLVDRQPLQGVTRHLAQPVERFVADRRYRSALVDPPWYPRQLAEWSSAAARAVGTGGVILVSAWPWNTRPGARAELDDAMSSFSRWAVVQRSVASLEYEPPQFELVARRYTVDPDLSRSPLLGELLQLTVTGTPPPPPVPSPGVRWHRFTADSYQLAVRHGGGTELDIAFLPGADGWHWPYVSARAPDLGRIDVWSSEGEVASCSAGDALAAMLRRAFTSPDARAFDGALGQAPSLLSWRIPRPPYKRWIEWQHQQ